MKKIIYTIFTLVICAAAWVACKEEEDTLNLSRQFRPSVFNITESETSASLEWSPSLFTIPGEVQYVIEVSKDGVAFANVEFTETTPEPVVTIFDSEIDIKTDYYARVKALGIGSAEDSNWLISEAFQITGEIFILPVREHDVVVDQALIRWIPGSDIAKIVITPSGGPPVEIVVSALEMAAGEKLVSGLTESTFYTVEVFSGDDISKGDDSFTTKASYATANLIDLRGITGNPKILRDTMFDVLSGSVIWLRRGEIYTVEGTDAKNFDRSLTIMSGPDFNPEFARIHLTSNYNFVASSTIDSIVFRDIVFKGVRPLGASYDNDYIINANVVVNVGKIRLDNCKISRLRGTVRLQTASTGAHVTDYYINNCTVDSIREFAVVMASAASNFANVRITNSTFYRCRRYVNHGVTGNLLLSIDNCTFNELPTGGPAGAPVNYFIDFNTFASTIEIKNSILGKTWIETVGNTDVGGIRANASSTITVTNSYSLTDFVSTVATFQIPGITAYPKSSTDVYTNPGIGDFTIKDLGFPGATNAGDPRWRQ